MASDLAPTKRPVTVVPPLTPFDENLRVDYSNLARVIDYVVDDCNASIVVAAGVEAQEYQYLDWDSRKELITRTIDFVDGRRPVAVGVTHPSFRQAIELAQLAERKGAAFLQVLAPNRPIGGPTPTSDIIAYFEAIARETSLPLMFYLNQGPGADPSPAATVEIAKIDRVKYVKESSRDLSRVSRLIVEIEHAGHAHYFTTMQMLLASLLLGGTGVTLPPPASFLANKIIEAYVAGNIKEAARLQLQFALFPARWMDAGMATVMKHAMTYLGVPCGDPYPPYPPIGSEKLAQLHAYLQSTDFKPVRG
ncbi:MAG: dihydrodipicolinate synthase family protein [Beijerinckiaceae bacterium]|nr:dihydrodipicolinate synthase family protein [Beijerinckiaceae bacterium]